MSGSIHALLKYTYARSKLARYLWLKWKWRQRRRSMAVSDMEFAQALYMKKTGKKLNLEAPVTYDEKLWYLKLSNRDPLLTRCSDKYLVRRYVEECGLGHILNELYGVYQNANDIEFADLPSPCFFKCNHTSGYNAIYDRDKHFDKKDFIRRFNLALQQNYYAISREWNYKNIEPCIICERVLSDPLSPVGLVDYRVFCFGGKAKMLVVGIGTCLEDGSHSGTGRRNIYDLDFNYEQVTMNYENFPPEIVPKPANYDKMISYAEILAAPFAHCRVDFYNIDGDIYFGEMTFYQGGALNNIDPEEWSIKLGDWIDLTGYELIEND